MNGGSKRTGQDFKRVILLAAREPLDFGYIAGREDGRYFLGENKDMRCQEDGPEGPSSVATLFVGETAIVPNHLHSVTRLQQSHTGDRRPAAYNQP